MSLTTSFRATTNLHPMRLTTAQIDTIKSTAQDILIYNLILYINQGI